MYKPIGVPNVRGFYESFEIADAGELLAQWTTPEQREYNASTVQCKSCRGWGYQVTRRGRDVIRDNYGCAACGGLGKVRRESAVIESESADAA